MQLTRYTDFSLRLLMYLAAHPDGGTVERASRAFRAPREHMRKVAKDLVNAGYVAATRGRGGGLRLARTPESIKVGDVVRKTEPHLDLLECFDASLDDCPITPACRLKRVLERARSAFLAVLDDTSLADLAAKPAAMLRLLDPT